MTIRLANDRLRLWLDPSDGVSWQALEARRGDDWLALVPDCRESGARDDAGARAGQDESAPLQAASFHMLPYSNRLREGRFTFQGASYQLGRAARHAIHGALRHLQWQVEVQSEERALCTFDSRHGGGQQVDWPWPIEASVDHVLDGARLSSAITLTNRGMRAMPAGFGWHPYFVRTIDGAQPELQIPVDGVFPDASGDLLPDGAPIRLPGELDFRTPRALDPTQRIDCCLAGLAGETRIRWPDAALGLTMTASPVCRFLVLYNPDMPHFAIEPVTNANDGFNLAERGIDAGRQTLQPGETLRATMTLELDA